MSERGPISPIVLRGRAVDVTIREAGGGEGFEQVGLVFDCNALADLEIAYTNGVMVAVIGPLDGPDGDPLLDAKGDQLEGPLRDGNGDLVMRRAFGVEAFEAEMDVYPFVALRKAFSCLLGLPLREAGARMDPERLRDYFVAVGAALAIANGVDPTQALEGAQARMTQIERSVSEHFASNADAEPSEPETELPNPSLGDTPGMTGSEPSPAPAGS